MVESRNKTLHIIINGFGTFRPLSKLRTELSNMAVAWICIDLAECFPDLRSSSGTRLRGLNRHGDGSKEGTVDELVMSLPLSVVGVVGENVIGDDGGRRCGCRSIKESGQIITIKESMNLSAPH